LTTSGTETGNVVGSAVLHDTADLEGGYLVAAGIPAPTITFTLIAPDNTVAYTETQTVTGTGNYSTAGAPVAAQVGLYYWNVGYNANGSPFDTNASHNGLNDTAEQVTTVKATPTL